MTAITFDTLKFVEHLKDSGISEKQAKAISEAFRDAQSEMKIATKHDIKELGHRITDLEYRITIKVGAMLTVAASLIVLLQKIL
jgi:polyhydroxyalkanoate synthesis regulator phasin